MLGAAVVATIQPLAILGASQPVLAKEPQVPSFLKPIAQTASIEPTSLSEVAEVPAYVPPPPSDIYSGTGDYYLDWIIAHESGGNPYAMNSIGACGLGQSLPCSKVLSVCGSLANVPCQINWIRNYCISSYGSTYNAYVFWVNHRWY